MKTKRIGGKTYYHVPGVPVVKSMVLNGALLPLEEIRKTLTAWNMKPVVFGHPAKEGSMVSAADDDQLDKHVGFINNAKIENERMRADLNLEKEKIDAHPDGLRLLDQINNKKPINVSTAYHDTGYSAKGNKDGKVYDRVQTNISPDHLAILLDEQGACNCQDGCGINVNKNQGDMMSNVPEISEEMADSIATLISEMEQKIEEKLNTNAALAAGASQDFETCKKELKALSDRLDRLEKAKKAKKTEEDKPTANADEEQTKQGDTDLDDNNKKTEKKEEKSDEAKDEKKSERKLNTHSVSYAATKPTLNVNAGRQYFMPDFGEYLKNKQGA